MEEKSMMKYQEPELVVIELMPMDVIRTSGDGPLETPTDKDTDGNTVGGGGGAGFGQF